MARASYQHIPNIVLGKHYKKPKKKVVKTVKKIAPTSHYSLPPKPIRPVLKLKYLDS